MVCNGVIFLGLGFCVVKVFGEQFMGMFYCVLLFCDMVVVVVKQVCQWFVGCLLVYIVFDVVCQVSNQCGVFYQFLGIDDGVIFYCLNGFVKGLMFGFDWCGKSGFVLVVDCYWDNLFDVFMSGGDLCEIFFNYLVEVDVGDSLCGVGQCGQCVQYVVYGGGFND